MRGRFFAIAVLVAVPVLASDIQNDTQLRAMVDELARAKTIQLSTLEKPYFIQYTSSDSEQAFLRASLGGLLSSSRAHLRQPRLEIRVGDYKFDNTNSIFSGTPSLGLLPIDDDYQAIRKAIDALNQGTMRLAELMMDTAVTGALKGKNMEETDLGEGPTAPHPMAKAEFK